MASIPVLQLQKNYRNKMMQQFQIMPSTFQPSAKTAVTVLKITQTIMKPKPHIISYFALGAFSYVFKLTWRIEIVNKTKAWLQCGVFCFEEESK